MKLHFHTLPTFLALAGLLSAATPASSGTLQTLLSRMDKASAEFNAMTAKFTYLTHTDALNEDTTQSGTVIMKKVKPGQVQAILQYAPPDQQTVTFEKNQVKRYYPKIKTLEVYDLGKQAQQLDKFVMIGFGTSGAELDHDYEITVLGTEMLNGQSVTRLRLVPKGGEAKQYVKTVELWIPDQGDPYPLREKVLQPSDDYTLVTYSDVKINPPLPPDALQLKLPAGVKTVYPGK
jgi:outer membrane lipoprotein-sorting protein